jgi:hypothetical protein
MNEFLQLEIKNVKEILNTVKIFLANNSRNIKSTQYYLVLNDKKLLQVIEETLSDSLVDEKQRKIHLDLMETFLEKTKNVHSQISSLNDPESIELKRRIEEGVRYFGFTGNDKNDIFLLELKNTLEKVKKKEIVL